MPSPSLTASLLPTLLAALQASLSVLLVLLFGSLSAHLSLLSSQTGKALSKLCVKIFLPALLLTKIGSELHSGSAHRYVLILIWAFVCHFLSFLIGVAAHWGGGMQDWVTAAVMFNNTTSYPLLLIQSLDETGILEGLLGKGERTREAIERAKSYFLVFATVSSCLTFAVGPRLIDSEHAPEEEDDDRKDPEDDDDEDDSPIGQNTLQAQDRERSHSPTERSGLLLPPQSQNHQSRRPSSTPNSFFPSLNRPSTPEPASEPISSASVRRPSLIPKHHWLTLTPRIQWWLLFLWDFINTPLIGALLGAFIGLIPSLHRAFFADTKDGGIFTAWLTASLKSIGGLFVPLPVVVAGGSLYGCLIEMVRVRRMKKGGDGAEDREGEGENGVRGGGRREGQSTEVLTTIFVLVVRFVLWPVVSIATIYWMAKKSDWLGDDPMLWFAMMLMPTGPPAMKLITMVQVSYANEEEEHKIAKLLTISYAISPILAFTVVGAFTASRAAMES
ncbi:hypothetical protein ONS95_014370 [Cadophora gregata]|uniref:uncharacterized protein n=1 Tax=Cadophora gregata TaxID=51156 RepID=UPI0026DD71B8|nr:uncharacterized protein ONS95_014370 [Cadophora gregata]KAK0112629.1 hypothetical protein ONS95_014370 [Cadophora gregata]